MLKAINLQKDFKNSKNTFKILKDINILDKPIKAKGHLGIWNFE